MCYSYILHVSRLSDVGDVPANWDKNKVSFIFFLVFLDFTILRGHEWNEEWAVVACLRKRDSSESLTESLQGRSQQFCQRRSWKKMMTIDNESLSRKNVLFTSLLCNPVPELLLVCSTCWSAIHPVVRTVNFSVAFWQIYKPISKSSHSLIGVREMKEFYLWWLCWVKCFNSHSFLLRSQKKQLFQASLFALKEEKIWKRETVRQETYSIC